LTGARLQASDAEQRGNTFVSQFVAWSRLHHLGDYPDVKRAVDKYLSDRQDHLAFAYLLQSEWYRQHGRAFSGDPACHAFQGLVLYFFGALFYYTGLSLRGVAEQRGVDASALIPSVVTLAGNGSRYVDWLTDLRPVTISAPGAFEPFSQLLGRTLVAGMGLAGGSPGPRVTVTSQAKREVALGLVASVSPAKLNEAGAEARPAVGEHIHVVVSAHGETKEYGSTSRLARDEPLQADRIATLRWHDGELEIERFHTRAPGRGHETRRAGVTVGRHRPSHGRAVRADDAARDRAADAATPRLASRAGMTGFTAPSSGRGDDGAEPDVGRLVRAGRTCFADGARTTTAH
jgi:hypothetical protein